MSRTDKITPVAHCVIARRQNPLNPDEKQIVMVDTHNGHGKLMKLKRQERKHKRSARAHEHRHLRMALLLHDFNDFDIPPTRSTFRSTAIMATLF